MPTEPTINEVDFCSQIATAATQLLAQEPNPYFPFKEVRIEGIGTGTQKRKDLRFYDQSGKVVVTGEVKMPGTKEGQSPYNNDLIHDAQSKADNANVQFFFTWNVNQFVLFDRHQAQKPMLDRRVVDRQSERKFADRGA